MVWAALKIFIVSVSFSIIDGTCWTYIGQI